MLEVEQFYNEIRRPVYSKRNAIIHNIPDFWLTAVRSHFARLSPVVEGFGSSCSMDICEWVGGLGTDGMGGGNGVGMKG